MPGWLTPQSHEDDARLPASPHVYRELADAMYSGLRESGHGSDTILLAETAPRGASERAVTQSLAPLLFIRELYCLDRRFRPFTGDAAARARLPRRRRADSATRTPSCSTRRRSRTTRTRSRRRRRATDANRDHAVLADLGRLTRTLDRALASHGSARRFPVWLTEYGYQTDPPDPYVGLVVEDPGALPGRGRVARLPPPARALDRAVPALRRRAAARLPGERPAPLGHVPDRAADRGGQEEDGLRGLPAHRSTCRPPRPGGCSVFGLYRPATGRVAGDGAVQARRAATLADGRAPREHERGPASS